MPSVRSLLLVHFDAGNPIYLCLAYVALVAVLLAAAAAAAVRVRGAAALRLSRGATVCSSVGIEGLPLRLVVLRCGCPS